MKKLTAILTCLLFALSTGTMTVAADQAPPCEGCGCAAMSCCATDAASNDQPPSLPERVSIQKLMAAGLSATAFQSAVAGTPLMRPTVSPAFAAAGAPLFLRNCAFLI